MINNAYVLALADYIRTGIINPKTKLSFKIEDIIKEEYVEQIRNRLLELEVQDEVSETNKSRDR